MAREDRRHRPAPRQDSRSAFAADRDRLLYSPEYRRLAGVTQVASPEEGTIFHNRLTHTMKVGQIARRLAERMLAKYSSEVAELGGIDPEVAEAAALAHDLGHPPFGHVGEQELNRQLEEVGCEEGYEGNAQSFRIVTKLSTRRSSLVGLDLTRATLNATLKYPWSWSRGKHKFGYYQTEVADFDFAREGAKQDDRRTLEAELMDLADDITYSVHDVEDFFRVGLIPLDRLVLSDDERRRFTDYYYATAKGDGGITKRETERVFDELVKALPVARPYDRSQEMEGYLYQMSSELISRYVENVELEASASPFVRLDGALMREIKILKRLTWFYVIDSPALVTQQIGHKKVVRALFKMFHGVLDPKSEYGAKFSPRRYAETFAHEAKAATSQSEQERLRARHAADLVASMSDLEALSMYRRIAAVDQGSLLMPVL